MKAPKIDSSLAEVRQWRENLRLACENMSFEEEANHIHQIAQKIIQQYGLK